MSTQVLTAEAQLSTLLPSRQPGKGWSITLWIAQGLLATAFLAIGGMKLLPPADAQAAQMPAILRLFIGSAEVIGALGLILPAATRIKHLLTPLAALGLLTVMVLATLFHISRGEYQALPVPLAFAALAGFIAWGRTKKAPITPGGRV